MCAKTGRPKSENPKNVDAKVRMTTEMYRQISDYAHRNKITVAVAIRQGVTMLLESDQNK
ncbi:MAG: hypothetical protein IJ516_05535 [Phascolarctobacterium sp.]|nr:hypothetical protein [Phascolarctobacterium sp.]